MKLWDNVGTLVTCNAVFWRSISLYLPKLLATKWWSYLKNHPKIAHPKFWTYGTFANLVRFPTCRKFCLSSVDDLRVRRRLAGNEAKYIILQRVGKNKGLVLAVCGRKFLKFWKNIDTFRASNAVFQLSILRFVPKIFAVKRSQHYEVVKKRSK